MSFRIKRTNGTLKRLSISGQENDMDILQLLLKEQKEKEHDEKELEGLNEILLKRMSENPIKKNGGFCMKRPTMDYCSDYL
jgi:hypothetical protein